MPNGMQNGRVVNAEPLELGLRPEFEIQTAMISEFLSEQLCVKLDRQSRGVYLDPRCADSEFLTLAAT